MTAATVGYYLLERGFLSRQAIVEGDFVAEECTRRNRNFKITRRGGPSYFVKQVLTFDAEPISTLQREANCYWLWQNRTDSNTFPEVVPRMFGYDPVRHILVLELLPGGETLREYLHRQRAFPVEIAERLGNLLGRFHRAREHTAAELHASMFPRALPWILYMAEQQPENFPALSAGNSELLSIVKRYAEFGPALNALKAEWRHDGLIHGDLKWDNCILHSGEQGNGRTQWKLIDWEMADIGDTSWDAGTLLQSFLVHWILTLPGIEGGAVASPQFADLALEQMQPAVHAFWKTYVQAMEYDSATAQSQLLRCVRYGGARMIQSAFECLYYAPKVTPSAICLLQASLNVLTKPEEAREVLFGF